MSLHPGLREELAAIIAESGGEMGLALRHLETGEELHIHGDRVFPLASVFKIPVLVEAFRQIQAGRLDLDQRYTLTVAEKNLPSGVLLFFDDGLQPTLRDLLTLMIIISDNTATDMVMHRLEPGSVTRTMHELGLEEIHVPATVRELFDDLLPSSDPAQDLLEAAKMRPKRDGRAYSLGPDNNVGTPRALTRLLALIWEGQAVDREACDAMLDILLKQQLNDRLPRFLPPGTPCAHKTGTLPGLRNDSGIIYAGPQDHIAVTVFCRWDDEAVADDPEAAWARVLAIDTAFGKIGRVVYEMSKES